MTVFTPTSVILYVEDVNASTAFYRRALGEEPVETFEGFAVFALTEDVTLGLQARDGIDPEAVGAPGSVELSMSNATRDDVDRLHRSWSELGFPHGPGTHRARLRLHLRRHRSRRASPPRLRHRHDEPLTASLRPPTHPPA